MSISYGLALIHPNAADNKPHILGHQTARTAPGDTLLEVYNGPTSAGRVYGLTLTGQHLSAVGTVSLPTYSFETDPDTGMYRHSSGWLAFAVGGSTRMQVTGTGVEVIGTVTAASLAVGPSATSIAGDIGFYGHTAAAKPTVSGSRSGNAALASLLSGLAGLGLLTDSSTA